MLEGELDAQGDGRTGDEPGDPEVQDDAGRHTGRGDDRPVDYDALVNGDGAELGETGPTPPLPGRPAASQQPAAPSRCDPVHKDVIQVAESPWRDRTTDIRAMHLGVGVPIMRP